MEGEQDSHKITHNEGAQEIDVEKFNSISDLAKGEINYQSITPMKESYSMYR